MRKNPKQRQVVQTNRFLNRRGVACRQLLRADAGVRHAWIAVQELDAPLTAGDADSEALVLQPPAERFPQVGVEQKVVEGLLVLVVLAAEKEREHRPRAGERADGIAIEREPVQCGFVLGMRLQNLLEDISLKRVEDDEENVLLLGKLEEARRAGLAGWRRGNGRGPRGCDADTDQLHRDEDGADADRVTRKALGERYRQRQDDDPERDVDAEDRWQRVGLERFAVERTVAPGEKVPFDPGEHAESKEQVQHVGVGGARHEQQQDDDEDETGQRDREQHRNHLAGSDGELAELREIQGEREEDKERQRQGGGDRDAPPEARRQVSGKTHSTVSHDSRRRSWAARPVAAPWQRRNGRRAPSRVEAHTGTVSDFWRIKPSSTRVRRGQRDCQPRTPPPGRSAFRAGRSAFLPPSSLRRGGDGERGTHNGQRGTRRLGRRRAASRFQVQRRGEQRSAYSARAGARRSAPPAPARRRRRRASPRCGGSWRARRAGRG